MRLAVAAALLATAACGQPQPPRKPPVPTTAPPAPPPTTASTTAPPTTAAPTTTTAVRVRVTAAPPEGNEGAADQQLAAIARCESGGEPTRVSRSGKYRGKYQFDQRTWEGVGGTGDPAAASEAEQDARAAALYAQRGAQPWPTCGR